MYYKNEDKMDKDSEKNNMANQNNQLEIQNDLNEV